MCQILVYITLFSIDQINLPLPVVFTYTWKGKEIARKVETEQKVYLKIRKKLFCQVNRQLHEGFKKIFYCTRKDHFQELEKNYQIFGQKTPLWITPEKNTKNAKKSYDYELHITIEGFSIICFIFVISFLIGWIILKLVRYAARVRQDLIRNRLDQQFGDQAVHVLRKIPTAVLNETYFDGNDSAMDNCAICLEDCK